jgi:hypothetical protein
MLRPRAIASTIAEGSIDVSGRVAERSCWPRIDVLHTRCEHAAPTRRGATSHQRTLERRAAEAVLLEPGGNCRVETPIRTLLLAPLLAPLGACAARAPSASAPEPLTAEPVARAASGIDADLGSDSVVSPDSSDPIATTDIDVVPELSDTELAELEALPADGPCRNIEHGAAPSDRPTTRGAAAAPTRFDALDATTIRSVVRSHSDGFMGCYQLGLGRDPNLQGRVTTRFDIDPKGKVSDLTIAANDPFDCAVINCIRDHFITIEFPPPGNVVTVLYPLVFGHAD